VADLRRGSTATSSACSTMTSDSVERAAERTARSLGSNIGLFSGERVRARSGVRRIEAATGLHALSYGARGRDDSPHRRPSREKRHARRPPREIEKLLDRDASSERRSRTSSEKSRWAAHASTKMPEGGARKRPGGKALFSPCANGRCRFGKAPRMAEKAASTSSATRSSSSGRIGGDKASLVLTVSKGLTDRYKGRRNHQRVAQIVGGSGGATRHGQAGGSKSDKLDEALASLYTSLG